MTKQEFQKLTENLLFLDGATGSNLMAQGMPRGICTERWVIEHRDVIQKLQKSYIEAGSRINYAPTFGGNRLSLKQHGLENKIQEINSTLVSYSREIAETKPLWQETLPPPASLLLLTANIPMKMPLKCIKNRSQF